MELFPQKNDEIADLKQIVTDIYSSLTVNQAYDLHNHSAQLLKMKVNEP